MRFRIHYHYIKYRNGEAIKPGYRHVFVPVNEAAHEYAFEKHQIQDMSWSNSRGTSDPFAIYTTLIGYYPKGCIGYLYFNIIP